MIFSLCLLVSFLDVFQVLHCAFFHFSLFQFFSPYSGSYRCVCLIFHVFHILTIMQVLLCTYLIFSRFSVFLAIFQVLQCLWLIFVFQFFCHYTGPTVCISHISRFSLFLAIFRYLQCVFFILLVFQCFLPYFLSFHVSFSFCSFVILSPCSRSYNLSFSFSLLVSFLSIFQVLQCAFLNFHVLQFFLSYSR
jgi:hypothetical protein